MMNDVVRLPDHTPSKWPLAKLAFGAITALATITASVSASADPPERRNGVYRAAPRHANWNHSYYRARPVYSRGYYRAPPVVYGSPYYTPYSSPYYYPPPVVYGPGIGITFGVR